MVAGQQIYIYKIKSKFSFLLAATGRTDFPGGLGDMKQSDDAKWDVGAYVCIWRTDSLQAVSSNGPFQTKKKSLWKHILVKKLFCHFAPNYDDTMVANGSLWEPLDGPEKAAAATKIRQNLQRAKFDVSLAHLLLDRSPHTSPSTSRWHLIHPTVSRSLDFRFASVPRTRTEFENSAPSARNSLQKITETAGI